MEGSASTSPPQWKYDVFLSFRGDDTRKRFTDHLYTALRSQGIVTFKDDLQLQKGKPISSELRTAIENSRFAIIVISKNYASSAWCLDELLQILECMEERKTVLPIFYDVDPSDVRKKKRSFEEAFMEHEKKFWGDKKKVQSWRDALTKLASFSGWNSEGWHEAELIKDIVEVVRKRLSPPISSSVEDLVGIDSRLKPILAARVDGVCFIGIRGMGGIGKTTVARAFYDRVSHEYDDQIFLPDVRSSVEKSGLSRLQKQLLSKIGMQRDEIIFEDDQVGANLIKRFLYGKKVLLVLDDVSHSSHLEYLAGKQEWFGLGSTVVITSRDEHLLIQHGVKIILMVQNLCREEAIHLFSWRAFRKWCPDENFLDLSERVVEYADGLPLALKVLGSFLHGRKIDAWNSALDKLRDIGNSEILEKLKISYDDLDEKDKKIFLDIACFFNNKREGQVREQLDACGFNTRIGVDVLVEKSLLTVSDGRIRMHDLLQQLGRKIVLQESVEEPGKRSRLWCREDVNHVLSRHTGTEAIEGIVLQQDEASMVIMANAKSFSTMKRLRFLVINNVELCHGLEYLSSDLRVLKWRKFPLKSLPPDFNPENLLELNMCDSRIENLWNVMKPSKNLKIINLSYCLSLVKTPDFSGISSLEHLILEGCTRLDEIDPSVAVLPRLTLMNLKNCTNLMRLPSSVSGFKSLKFLNVSGCSKLEKVPEDLGHVEELDVSGTAIGEAPSSSHPWSVKLFPFRSLLNIITAKRRGLWLPSLCGFHNLKRLNLSNCNLSEGGILNELGCMPSLTYLDLSKNPLVKLPKTINQLSHLHRVLLFECHRLEEFPELPSGAYLLAGVFNCSSLKTAGVGGSRVAQELGEIVAPGKAIPEWVSHTSVGGSLISTVDLHEGWFNGLIGFAVCFVFTVQEHMPLPEWEYTLLNSFNFRLYIEGQRLNVRHPLYTYWKCVVFESEHRWLCYLPGSEPLQNIHAACLQFSVTARESYIEVKKCGIRLIYQEDAEAVVSEAE